MEIFEEEMTKTNKETLLLAISLDLKISTICYYENLSRNYIK